MYIFFTEKNKIKISCSVIIIRCCHVCPEGPLGSHPFPIQHLWFGKGRFHIQIQAGLQQPHGILGYSIWFSDEPVTLLEWDEGNTISLR